MKYLYLTDQHSQQRQTEKPVWIYPVLMAMEAQKRRDEGHEVFWDTNTFTNDLKVIDKPEGLDFLSLPMPDRKFTNAFDKRYQVYGNYKFHPATHMMVANGCWHGKCSFCVENKNKYQVRPMDIVIKELWECQRLGFREIFDDSGSFPTGEWMNNFCIQKSADMRLKRLVFGCNMRIGANVDFELMKFAGFRMVLFGIESANQSTLDRIGKGINAEEIIPFLKKASESGLEPHGAFMFGYSFESEAEELKTLDLCHYLLRKGYLKTAQASIYTQDGVRGIDRGLTKKIYDVGYSPEFWITKMKDIKQWEDIIYLGKSIKKGLGW